MSDVSAVFVAVGVSLALLVLIRDLVVPAVLGLFSRRTRFASRRRD